MSTIFICVECQTFVPIETVTSNDYGQPVHKECYERHLMRDLETGSATRGDCAGESQTKWPEVYRVAIWELKDALRAGLLLEARSAISDRLVELDKLPGLHTQERQAISDALENLRSLDGEDQKKKAAQVGREVLLKVSSISERFSRGPAERAS